MKLIVLLNSVIIILAAEQKPDKTHRCELVSVRGKNHTENVLASGLNRPYQLSIYKKEHKIYFSYNIGKNEADTFELGYIERGKQNVTVIQGVQNGFATAVDERNHHVYLGGSTGIYKYYIKKKQNEALEKIISRHNIWYMFFKEYLYFIDFPSQKLYKYDTVKTGAVPKHQKHITEKIYQFVIDKDDDQFITSDKGLFRIQNGTDARINYAKDMLFRGVALNNKGDAYFCGNHSIYVANKQTHNLTEIASIRNVFGITFDGEDNIIYSDPNKIVKLLPGTCK